MNHKIIARLASKVYENSVRYKEDGWESIKRLEGSIGFFGVAFKKAQSIIIAFRGTDGPQDWIFSNFCFALPVPGCIPGQYSQAYQFAKEVASSYPNMEKVIVGHSLGGGLAQLVGIALNLPSISFDAPGTLNIARYMFSEQELRKNKTTAYVGAPNVVNTCGKHITQLIQIMETPLWKEEPLWNQVKSYLDYTIFHHAMSRLVETFDDYGKPKFSVRVNQEEWFGLFKGMKNFNNLFAKQTLDQHGEKLLKAAECISGMSDDREVLPVPSVLLQLNPGIKGAQITIKVTKYFFFPSQEIGCGQELDNLFREGYNMQLQIAQGAERDRFDIIKNKEGETHIISQLVGWGQKIEFGPEVVHHRSRAIYTISKEYISFLRKTCDMSFFRDTCDAKKFLCQSKEIFNGNFHCEDEYGIPSQCSGKINCNTGQVVHDEL